MIYLEPLALGWRPYATSWLNAMPPLLAEGEARGVLECLFEWAFDPCLSFIQHHCKQMIDVSPMTAVVSALNFIKALVFDHAIAEEAADNRYLNGWVYGSMLFGLVWGIGGCLDGNSRPRFDEYVRHLCAGMDDDHPVPKCIGGRFDYLIPDSGLVYDYWLEVGLRGTIIPYKSQQIKPKQLGISKNLNCVILDNFLPW